MDLEDQEVEADIEAMADRQPDAEIPTPSNTIHGYPHSEPAVADVQQAKKPLNRSFKGATESALPTPPQEPDDRVAIKRERSTARIASIDAVDDLSGYDSDIFVVFGDTEIGAFCQCTEQSAKVARDYLRKADGQTDRAIAFYFDDIDEGRFVEAESPGRGRGEGLKKTGKEKGKQPTTVDDDGDVKTLSTKLSIPFGLSSLEDDSSRSVMLLLHSLQPESLHHTMVEIAEKQLHKIIDRRSRFLTGEILGNCRGYWKIYLAYTHYLFKKPGFEKLTDSMYQSICVYKNFSTFYHQLLAYLELEPPPLTPSKKKHAVDLPSSPLSVSQEFPEHFLDKTKHNKKKQKKVTKVIKSSEQVSQEAELRKFADRERAQRKRGLFATTTEDGAILVNLGKKVSEEAVCLHPELAAAMKPHQIEGLQFMWKQVLLVS